MSGSFNQNPIHVSTTQTQGDAVMNSQSKPVTTISIPVSTANSFTKMPVTTSLSQVLRLGTQLQDYPNLQSSPFNVAYNNGSYLFPDNGFASARNIYVKEEKTELENATTTPLQQPLRPSSSGSMSVSSPRPSSYSPMSIDREKGEKTPESVLRTVSRNEAYINRNELNLGDKSVKNAFGSLMLITVPPYQDGAGSRHASPQSSTVPLNNHHHHHHHQILRYPPNGDALLSASAINYADNEILPDGGFDVHVGSSLGSLDDGLMSGNLSVQGTGSGGTSTYDLFDGEAGQDSYMGDGNQEMQLSPHAFPSNAETFHLNDNSNLSAVQDQAPDGNSTLGNEIATSKCQSNNKLSVAPGIDKVKSKSRPNKASSPNRTGQQVCPVCAKLFGNSSALAKHKLTHSDERKYVCQLCTKAFKRQDHLNGHLLTHMNKKPYECKVEGCGKSYCDARSLRRHTENHHSSVSQSAVVAATAATVNAIAVRVGAPLTLPFNVDGKIETNSTSFLANALQSDRIRYAPPPVVSRPSVVPPQPLPYSTSSPTSVTTATDSKMNSSAATQLQLLAFQQQEQHQVGEHPGPALSWQQQPNSNILFINSSSLAQQVFDGGSGGQQQQSSSPPSSERPSSHTPDMAEEYIGQNHAVAGSNSSPIQNVLTPSVLAQHLKLGLPPPAQFSQENATSLVDRQIKLSDILSQSSLVQSIVATTQALSLDAANPTLNLRNQWTQPVICQSNLRTPVNALSMERKPVGCTLCDRRFKNIPALNGHMRLHGGYLKKDVNGTKKTEKKSNNFRPLNRLLTASVKVRALIEEKIIHKRIVNPTMNITIDHPQPPLPSLILPQRPALTSTPASYASTIQPTSSLVLQNPCQDELLTFSDHPCLNEQQQMHPSPVPQHSQLQDQLQDQMLPPQTPPLPLQSHDSHHHHQQHHHHHHHHHQHHHQQLQQQEQEQEIDSTVFGSAEDEAQSDMQRQIEIIKQGLMSNQPILEKFRRHSDSDHFMAPRRTYLDTISSSSLVEYLRHKVVGKRMQRTGSDPGEFVVGNFAGMFDEMDEDCPPDEDIMENAADEELSEDGFQNEARLPDDGLQNEERLPDDLQNEARLPDDGLPDDDELPPMASDAMPPGEIMDFEISPLEEPLPPTISIPSEIGRNESSILAAHLAAPISTMVGDINMDIPSPCEISYEEAPMASTLTVTPKVKSEEDDDVFLSPSSIPTSPIRTKKKHRPGPITIPDPADPVGYQSRLRSPRLWEPISGNKTCSPPPYTPPPMLSPVRCGAGLFWQVISSSGSATPKSAPITLDRTGALEGLPPVEVEDDICEPPETDIKPHVNVGSNFQASLPYLRTDSYGYDPKWDDLVWSPKTEEPLTEREVDMYLQFACCAAVPGGGRNKEYALHVLHMADGNIEEAMIRLMDPAPKLQASHPLLTYPYAESDKWSSEEIDVYQHALLNYDKDFFSIAHEVKTKTVKQCIQFYYLWKKICPDEYKRLRSLRRKKEIEGAYNLRSKLFDNDEDSPRSCDRAVSPARSTDNPSERFPCDYPDCLASFASRQALNGHIRVHGGNGTGPKPAHSNSNRSRSPANFDDSGGQQYSPYPNPASNASTQYGDPVEEFPCKICGKVFFKVKSRSAHMKSHRPIDADKHK